MDVSIIKITVKMGIKFSEITPSSNLSIQYCSYKLTEFHGTAG